MFSIDVVGQDNFLDMPTESRELYFQLGMYADDEGFVSPKKVMRVVGAAEDTIKLLILKNFIFPFKSGVIVITHWNQNNFIRSDRFMATTFKEEKQEWGTYLRGIPMVNQRLPQEGREVKEVSKNKLSFTKIEKPKNLQ